MMNEILPRYKPYPLPSIYPVPEYLANEKLKRDYEETKITLQVPWMGVVTMAFAHYPVFFNTLWEGVKELAASREFVEACGELRLFAESAASRLEPQSIHSKLRDKGYAEREIEDIFALNEVFSHGNMSYLMIATAARLLLEGHSLGDETIVSAFNGCHGPSSETQLLLMEPHHVESSTSALYESIKTTLGLPFVNTDYRAFARWPSYFSLAWQGLSNKALTEDYESRVSDVHHFATQKMVGLPNPGGLSPKVLQDAARKDASLAEILEVVRLFQWLLPGLVTNVAFFRAQLIDTGSVKVS